MPIAIRTRDEGMAHARDENTGCPYHLSHVVDPIRVANVSTGECVEVGCFLAVKVNDKRRKLLRERGRCEPDSQDCGQDKVAQCVVTVNVHQIPHQRLSAQG
jgi:hypothetical protein